MTLRQLELFVAVAESGSFSKGGELVSLTQSTVSQHIAALEESFGLKLIDRTGRGIALTSGGELLLQQARRVLAEVADLRQNLSRFVGMQDVRVSIGASNIPANYLLPDLLPVLRQQYPGLQLQVITSDSKQALEAVRLRQVELGFVGVHVKDALLTGLPVCRDRLVLIVGANHSLRRVGRITLADLAGQEMILREAGSGTYQNLLQALNDAGFDPDQLNVVARFGSNEAVRRAVINGSGCAFVSDLSIRDHLRREEVFAVAVDGLQIERQLSLVYLSQRHLSPAARTVIDLISEYCSVSAGCC